MSKRPVSTTCGSSRLAEVPQLGERGGGWVALQFVLMAAIVGARPDRTGLARSSALVAESRRCAARLLAVRSWLCRRTRARFRLHAVSAAGGQPGNWRSRGRTRSSGIPSTRAASSSSRASRSRSRRGRSPERPPWRPMGAQGAGRGALPRGDLPGVRGLQRSQSASGSSPSSTDFREVGCAAW